MAVFRVERNKGYTVMSNHHLRNKELSLKAKGLLSQMLSLPEDWDYTLAGLSFINREKIDAIREAIKELERAGYIVRSRERDEKGRLRGTDYVIFEQPQTPPVSDLPILENPTLDNPTLEKPMLENPTLENPTQLNKDISRTDLSKKEKSNTDISNTHSIPMEKKGIISDRCELNRQIKADNALLRELKAAVKKLAQEVLHSLPELAKSMEFLRQKLLIFCYQLNHIRTGKSVIGKSVDAWNINLNRYSEVVDQIKETKRERTDLLAEKKELPFWNIPRKNELTARIAELTELLEELQSEKAILLDNMDCTDGKDVSKVRKKVALMEANLKELDEQEQKYSAELETALAEYAELKTQGEQFDPVELHDTRQELRPEMEQTAVQRVKEKYGDKYSHRTMDDSKRDVSRHLDEYAESQEIRQIQREREYQQRRQNKAKQERKKQDDWER